MKIWMVTGGARSGKSRTAVKLASDLGGDDVAFVATARGTDEEMRRRIREHRTGRPSTWNTFEPPADPARAIRETRCRVVVLDCLTLLVADAVAPAGSAREAVGAAGEKVDELLAAADGRDGSLIVVTNEVGLGVVPARRSARWFRDALGAVNQRIAGAADRVLLMVSGVPVELDGRHADV